jgi:hypothetical protein
MKTKLILFTAVTFSALMAGLTYAADQARGKADQANTRHSKSEDDKHASELKGKPRPMKYSELAHRAGSNHPTLMSNGRQDSGEKRITDTPSQHLPTIDFHPSALSDPATADKTDLKIIEPANDRPQSARIPDDNLTPAGSPGVHRPQPGAASIGGRAAQSDRHSAAVIDGSEMKRRP